MVLWVCKKMLIFSFLRTFFFSLFIKKSWREGPIRKPSLNVAYIQGLSASSALASAAQANTRGIVTAMGGTPGEAATAAAGEASGVSAVSDNGTHDLLSQILDLIKPKQGAAPNLPKNAVAANNALSTGSIGPTFIAGVVHDG